MLVQGKIRYRKIIGICLVSFLVAGQARSSTTLISAATVIDNLTATVFEDTTAAENDNQADDDHGPLKFNITWRAPLDDSRKPSSYSSDGSMWVPTERSRICSRHFVGNEKSENPQSPSYHPSIFPSVYKKQTVSTQSASDRVLITSVRKNDDDDDDRGENLCPDDETLFYTTWDGNRCHAVLPENKFFSDAPELTIRPTCSYDIQVFANPRSNLQLEAPKIVLTVPKCVGRWCSCEDAQRYLPIPKVDIVTSNNRRRRRREITITWKSTIHPESRVHSFGVPFLVSNNRLAVYNLTKIAIVTSTVSSYRWFIDNSTDFDITAGGKVSVTAQDNRGCFGTPGYALVDPLVASLDASVDRPVHWHVWTFLGLGLSSMTILGGIISFLYARNKKAYKPIWTNDQRTQGLMGLSRLRSQQKLADSTLRERNVLYVEQQVQHDATDRGECGECGECTDAAAAAAEDQFQVSHERLKFIRELGEGQFGKVYLGRLENEHGYRRDSVLVAIKISNCPADRGSTETSISQARQQFLAEIETMKNVGAHPHLVRLIATCTLPVENNPICLILEYLEGGDLLAHLHRIRDSLECYRGRYCCRTAAGDQAAAAAAAEQQLMVPFDSGVPHVSSSRIQQTHHQSLCKTIYTTLPSAPDNRSPATMAKFPDFSATDTLKCIDDTPAASEEYAGRVYMNSGDEENSSDYDLDGGRFISFASDIARGMRHLESRGIIHRDLAARNILLSSDMTLKISDFGLARNDRVYVIAGGSGEDGVRRLPVRWMAPEALRDRAFTSKSDVWSFAIVLWEIGTLGAFPYFDIQDDRVVRYVLHDGGRLRRPSGISPLLYDTIMLSCWASRPENRPSFVEIVERLSTLGEPSKIFNATSNPC